MHYFAQNIDSEYTLEAVQITHNLFLSKNKRKMYTSLHPSFIIEKWGIKAYTIHGRYPEVNERRHKKTVFLPMRKQRHRSALRSCSAPLFLLHG